VKLEKCINEVKIWFTSSLLTLNDTKTEFMILGSSTLLRRLPDVTLKVGTTCIKPSKCLGNLGVHLDSTLSFTNHVKIVCMRAFNSLRLIARIKKVLVTIIALCSFMCLTYHTLTSAPLFFMVFHILS